MSKYSGTVKWFSNRKGFGFINPSSENSPTQEAIFVHQTSIYSDGDYRTLTEGAPVEFEIETEASGKLKAINVTSPGGLSIKPPKRERKRAPRKPNDDGANGENGDSHDAAPPAGATDDVAPVKERNGRKKKPAMKKAPPAETAEGTPSTRPPRDPPFHDQLTDEVKASIAAKGVDLGRKMTIDIALGGARIKLGQGGYAGLADARGMVGEGTYTCDPAGNVSFIWERCLIFSDGTWKATTTDSLLKSLSLPKDPIMAVGPEETAATLWGADKSDPKDALAENAFKMKNIVLTRPPGNPGGRRRPRSYNRKA